MSNQNVVRTKAHSKDKELFTTPIKIGKYFLG